MNMNGIHSSMASIKITDEAWANIFNKRKEVKCKECNDTGVIQENDCTVMVPYECKTKQDEHDL